MKDYYPNELLNRNSQLPDQEVILERFRQIVLNPPQEIEETENVEEQAMDELGPEHAEADAVFEEVTETPDDHDEYLEDTDESIDGSEAADDSLYSEDSELTETLEGEEGDGVATDLEPEHDAGIDDSDDLVDAVDEMPDSENTDFEDELE